MNTEQMSVLEMYCNSLEFHKRGANLFPLLSGKPKDRHYKFLRARSIIPLSSRDVLILFHHLLLFLLLLLENDGDPARHCPLRVLSKDFNKERSRSEDSLPHISDSSSKQFLSSNGYFMYSENAPVTFCQNN